MELLQQVVAVSAEQESSPVADLHNQKYFMGFGVSLVLMCIAEQLSGFEPVV
jgi:hypothetical protein